MSPKKQNKPKQPDNVALSSGPRVGVPIAIPGSSPTVARPVYVPVQASGTAGGPYVGETLGESSSPSPGMNSDNPSFSLDSPPPAPGQARSDSRKRLAIAALNNHTSATTGIHSNLTSSTTTLSDTAPCVSENVMDTDEVPTPFVVVDRSRGAYGARLARSNAASTTARSVVIDQAPGSNRSVGIIFYAIPIKKGSTESAESIVRSFMKRLTSKHHSFGSWDIVPSKKSAFEDQVDYCGIRFKSCDPTDALVLYQLASDNSVLSPELKGTRVEFLTGQGVVLNQFRRLSIPALKANINEAFKTAVAKALEIKGVQIFGRPFTMRQSENKLFFILMDGSPEFIDSIAGSSLEVGTSKNVFQIDPPNKSVPTHPFHCVVRNLKELVAIGELEEYVNGCITLHGAQCEWEFSYMDNDQDNWHFALTTFEATDKIIKGWEFVSSHVAFEASDPVMLYDENMGLTKAALETKRYYRKLNGGRTDAAESSASAAMVSNLVNQLETARINHEAVDKERFQEMARLGSSLAEVVNRIDKSSEVALVRHQDQQDQWMQQQQIWMEMTRVDREIADSRHHMSMRYARICSELAALKVSISSSTESRTSLEITSMLLPQEHRAAFDNLIQSASKRLEQYESEYRSVQKELGELEASMSAPVARAQISPARFSGRGSSIAITNSSSAPAAAVVQELDEEMSDVCHNLPSLTSIPTVIGPSCSKLRCNIGLIKERLILPFRSVVPAEVFLLGILLINITFRLAASGARSVLCSPDRLGSLASFVMIYCLISPVSASLVQGRTPGTDYSSLVLLAIFFINITGTKNLSKMNCLADIINRDQPALVIITETNLEVNDRRFNTSGYHYFFSPLSHGGVALAVRNDLTVLSVNNFQANQTLQGRAIAADLSLKCGVGLNRRICIIGIYAPTASIIKNDPESMRKIAVFWHELSIYISSLTCDWIISGDFNATIRDTEMDTPLEWQPHRDLARKTARDEFTSFLAANNCWDAWNCVPDLDVMSSWTSKGFSQQREGGTIVDRTVASASIPRSCLQISIHPDAFVPRTNHRMVVCQYQVQRLSGRSTTIPESVPLDLPRSRVNFPKAYLTDSVEIKERFRSLLDNQIEELQESGFSFEVDSSTFDRVYHKFIEIVKLSAVSAFGMRKVFKNSYRGNSLAISDTLRNKKQIRQLRAAAKEERLVIFHRHHRWAHRVTQEVRAEFPSLDFIDALSAKHKLLSKNQYKYQVEADQALMVRREKNNETVLLRNRGSKAMQRSRQMIQPRALYSSGSSDILLTTPESVKREYIRYVSKELYARSDTQVPKPWLENASVSASLKYRTSKVPFAWPVCYDRVSWDSMIRLGNRQPSPGPDDMEKWFHLFMSDKANDISMSLTNHIISCNDWGSGDVKAVTMLALYKKGIYSILSNYRFLWLTNFHAAAATSQLARKLQFYVDELSLLPEYQIATRPGVQTRDLTSFIAQLQCWVQRGKAEEAKLYVCQRDDMKGFDNQIPEAFEDAVDFFGINPNIIPFDRSSNSQVRCRICTAYGLTESFMLSGVNRQGGATSPIKFNLKAAMGYHWLAHHHAELDIPRVIPRSRHTKFSTRLSVSPLQLWAMDDSLLLSTTVSGLQRGVEIQEYFNHAYGGITNWMPGKSCAYSLHTDEPSRDITFTSFDGEHTLRILPKVEFLRTMINDPGHHAKVIESIINSVSIPTKHNGHRHTMALVRQWIATLVMPKINAKLRLQPISDDAAFKLDTKLIDRIRNYMGWYYKPSRNILFRPIDAHGFGFPSIQSSNRVILISGIERDLNHHLSAYKKMAQITYNDLSCQVYQCANPFSAESCGLKPRSNHTMDLMPFPESWAAARGVIKTFKTCDTFKRASSSYVGCSRTRCRQTCDYNMKSMVDISFMDNRMQDMASGDITIEHLCNTAFHHLQDRYSTDPLRLLVETIRRSPLARRMVKDAFRWNHKDQLILQDHVQGNPLHLDILNLVRDWKDVSSSSRGDMIRGSREIVDALRCRLLHYANQPLDTSAVIDGRFVLATDGSKFGDSSIVSGSITGLVEIGLRFTGEDVKWALHGEILSMLTALLIAQSVRGTHPTFQFVFLTDYITLVRRLNSRDAVKVHELDKMADAGIYKVILSIWREVGQYSVIRHVKAHSDSVDVASKFNALADALAKQSRYLPTIEIDFPKVHLPDFIFKQSNRSGLHARLTRIMLADASRDIHLRTESLATIEIAYGKQYYPRFRYRYCTSDWSISIQALLRGRVLDTNSRRYRSGTDANLLDGPLCACGNVAETEHHVFVECRIYEECRSQIRKDLSKRLKSRWTEIANYILSQTGQESAELGQYQTILEDIHNWLFHDDPRWPGATSRFYNGLVPRLESLFPLEAGFTTLHIRQLKEECHSSLIGLAGYIWSNRNRRARQLAATGNLELDIVDAGA